MLVCCVCTGWSPLHEAACKGYLAIHLYLYNMLVCCVCTGWSPLHEAACKGYLAIHIYLYNMLVCCVCTGWSPHHEAACKGYLATHLYLYNMLCCQGGRHSTKQPAKATLRCAKLYLRKEPKSTYMDTVTKHRYMMQLSTTIPRFTLALQYTFSKIKKLLKFNFLNFVSADTFWKF